MINFAISWACHNSGDFFCAKTSKRPHSTTFLKNYSGIFTSIITKLASLFISEGIFPSRFRLNSGHTTSEEPGLNITDQASYRPISNLNTTSKVLERLYLAWLVPQVAPSFCPLQSAYRKLHSTKTALLKIVNDMFEAVYIGRTIVLITLDSSTAFDTIDHSIVMKRLKSSLGVTGLALSWLRLYLTDRISFVKVGSASSSIVYYNTGVPQWSILVPLLLSLHISLSLSLFNTIPLSEVISAFGGKFHQYADNTQIYLAVNIENSRQALVDLAACS